MKASFLFVTGTARSGSTLLCRMLSAHREVMLASDAYFPLFRSLRNAILRATDDPTLAGYIERPFQDYYFDPAHLRALDAVQSGDPSVPFPADSWPELRQAVALRAQHESPDLLPHLERLQGRTHREAFESACAIVAEARGERDRRFIGCKEVWVIELFAALARTWPDARFVVLLRDPRATLASMLALAERDDSQRAHTLSFLRHWRKYVAFAEHYLNQPLFQGRLHVVRYERLVSDPRSAASALCAFLGIEMDSGMLDREKYLDYATGHPWTGNSSFVPKLGGISTAQMDRWRDQLTPTQLSLVDLVTHPETLLTEYGLDGPTTTPRADPGLLDLLIEDDKRQVSWRSDDGNPARELEREIGRAGLLARPAPPDLDERRRAFLFDDVFAELRQSS